MSIYEPLKIFDPEGRSHVAPDRIRYFTDICRGKVVLHVGCADWPITKERLRDGRLLHAALSGVCQQLVGTDISNDGLAMLKSAGFRDLVNVPAERMTLDTFGHTFDVVLAGDVLEHMTNPGTLIENARDLLSPGGQLVIGAPSALTLINFRAWLLRRELVHKDHCFYFSP
ncbi:MAG: class I SAM-dependent methyltransferase, partial [Kiritimatiellia bacterium]